MLPTFPDVSQICTMKAILDLLSSTNSKFGGNSFAIPKIRVSGENSRLRDLHITKGIVFKRWTQRKNSLSTFNPGGLKSEGTTQNLFDAWEDWDCRSNWYKRWAVIVDYIFVESDKVWKRTASKGIPHFFRTCTSFNLYTQNRRILQ
jgi:hypothetical protein